MREGKSAMKADEDWQREDEGGRSLALMNGDTDDNIQVFSFNLPPRAAARGVEVIGSTPARA